MWKPEVINVKVKSPEKVEARLAHLSEQIGLLDENIRFLDTDGQHENARTADRRMKEFEKEHKVLREALKSHG